MSVQSYEAYKKEQHYVSDLVAAFLGGMPGLWLNQRGKVRVTWSEKGETKTEEMSMRKFIGLVRGSNKEGRDITQVVKI